MSTDPIVLRVLWGDAILQTLRLRAGRPVWARELPLPEGSPDWCVLDAGGRLSGPDGDAQPIPKDGEARVAAAGVVFVAERPGPRAFPRAGRLTRTKVIVAGSIAAHAALLAFAATSRGPSPEEADRARLAEMRRYRIAIALRDDPRAEPPTGEPAGGLERGTDGREGSAGTRARAEAPRFGAGPDPHVEREAALREGARFGIIGLSSPTSAWGTSVGDASGAGGLGLLGVGGVGRARAPGAAWAPGATPAASVRAGEWDDNASYREFMRFLASQRGHDGAPEAADVGDRTFVVVRDAAGKAVPACWLDVRDAQGQRTQLRTTAAGRALLFPHAERLSPPVTVTARCGAAGTSLGSLATLEPDAALVIDLRGARRVPDVRRVQLGFVLDTTGSMSEEIAELKSTIRQVADLVAHEAIALEIGLAEYKDHGDAYVTRAYPMTGDLAAFSRTIEHLSAGGGGDTPEAVDEGLRAGLDGLGWSLDATVKMAFLVGDAPPHEDPRARWFGEAKRYAHAGIPVYTIAASGMDTFGQLAWRQIAQYTGGTNMFVLRGGAGPQSAGAGEPLTACGTTEKQYTSGNLHQLVVAKVKAELAAVDAEPTRIRGRGQDERKSDCPPQQVAQR